MFARGLFCLLMLLSLSSHASEIEVSQTIANNLQTLAAYRVTDGRLAVDTGHLAGGLTMTGPRPSAPERLVMHALDGDALIHYEQTTWRERISLRLARRKATNQWDIELLRRPRGDSRSTFVWFVQQADEPLQLRVKDHTYRGDSLWQLWLAEPELCRAELMPLLAVLRPDWPLAQQASVTKQLLGTLAPAQSREHRQHWQSLVHKLAHDRAALREQAYRELFAARPAVLVYLRTLDPDTLDAEQRYHVRHLLSAIEGDEDTPLSAALDLFGSEH